MWKCPKCGRSFKNENQGHYCRKAPETVDEYILAQDEAIRGHLESVRNVLRASLPDAVEKISWSMPTWWKGHISTCTSPPVWTNQCHWKICWALCANCRKQAINGFFSAKDVLSLVK